MKQINCWVSEELAEKVERAAAEDHRSVSAWVRLLLLANLPEDENAEEIEAVA